MKSLLKTGRNGIVCIVLLLVVTTPYQGVQGANTETNRTDGINDAIVAAGPPLRDPFWPVGYRPAKMVTEVSTAQSTVIRRDVASDWNTAMQSIDIQGVSSRAGDEFYAVINGEVKSKGDKVSVDLDGKIYTWEIQLITPPGSVKLRRVTVR